MSLLDRAEVPYLAWLGSGSDMQQDGFASPKKISWRSPQTNLKKQEAQTTTKANTESSISPPQQVDNGSIDCISGQDYQPERCRWFRQVRSGTLIARCVDWGWIHSGESFLPWYTSFQSNPIQSNRTVCKVPSRKGKFRIGPTSS